VYLGPKQPRAGRLALTPRPAERQFHQPAFLTSNDYTIGKRSIFTYWKKAPEGRFVLVPTCLI